MMVSFSVSALLWSRRGKFELKWGHPPWGVSLSVNSSTLTTASLQVKKPRNVHNTDFLRLGLINLAARIALLTNDAQSRVNCGGVITRYPILRNILSSHRLLVIFPFVFALPRMCIHSFILIPSNKHMNMAVRGDHVTTASRAHHSGQT